MLEGWTPNQQSLNRSCIVHSWKCRFHLSALFYSESNNLCLLKMFSDLWFHCQYGKGFGSIHTSFRNRELLRYNLVTLLLQCTNGTQAQPGGRGEGPYALDSEERYPGNGPLGGHLLPWRSAWPGGALTADRVNAPTEMPKDTTSMGLT